MDGRERGEGTPPVVHGHRESNCAKAGEFSTCALAWRAGLGLVASPRRPAGQSVEPTGERPALQWATGDVPTANLPRRRLEWSLISPASEAISTAFPTFCNTNRLISQSSIGPEPRSIVQCNASSTAHCAVQVPPLTLLENGNGPFPFREWAGPRLHRFAQLPLLIDPPLRFLVELLFATRPSAPAAVEPSSSTKRKETKKTPNRTDRSAKLTVAKLEYLFFHLPMTAPPWTRRAS